MAKKTTPSMTDVFKKTEPSQAAGADIIKARGVGLKVSEWVEVDKIARELSIKPHAVTVYLLRYGLKEYKAGKIKPEKKQTVTFPEL